MFSVSKLLPHCSDGTRRNDTVGLQKNQRVLQSSQNERYSKDFPCISIHTVNNELEHIIEGKVVHVYPQLTDPVHNLFALNNISPTQYHQHVKAGFQ